MTARMRRIDHPGAPAPERVRALACNAVPLRVTLPAGQSLSAAATDALAGAGFAFGYLRLDGAAVRPLTFVTPAPAPGDGHAAWYSDTHRAPGGVTLRHAGAHLGLRDGRAFLHCHGNWQGTPDQPDCGHLLCDDTILDADCTITGWGLHSAGLVASPDAETAFTLFQPEARPGGDTANAHLLSLRPNQDIRAALLAFARDRGITAARIEGIGSLVGTAFADGRTLDSYATEILIVGGRLQDDAVTLDVASVGFDGRGMAGRLAPGANAVCVTAEILIIADA